MTENNPVRDNVSDVFEATLVPENNPETVSKPHLPVTWREIVVVILGIVLADVTVYHGAGFAGLALLLFFLPLLLWIGVPKPRFAGQLFLLFSLIALVALKLLWCGFFGAFIAGLFLIFTFGTVLANRKCHVPNVLEYIFTSVFLSGGNGLVQYQNTGSKLRFMPSKAAWYAIFLPAMMLALFGGIFIMANPSLVQWVQNFFSNINHWLKNSLPEGMQMVFWVVVCWILVGLLRPINYFKETFLTAFETFCDDLGINRKLKPPVSEEAKSPYYAAYRNMFIVMIPLFAVYLVFEFQTLWFRTFEEGFYYAGYAHQGAAWLTLALAISTLLLSAVFRQEMYHDPRAAQLQKLAFFWSAENLILALAVYNRLLIYINFNGMTRMRVVGLLGITAVLVGFLFVIMKIAKQKKFSWLLNRYAWTGLLMVYLGLVLPVDWIVHHYNVQRILSGDLAPAVQTSPILKANSTEGVLTLFPLLHSENGKISEGIKAVLAEKFITLDSRENTEHSRGFQWTKYQYAETLFKRKMEENKEIFADYLNNDSKRYQKAQEFRDYVYQWY